MACRPSCSRATHSTRRTRLTGTASPTFYSQHVWAWKRNPAGPLAMWNPNVHC